MNKLISHFHIVRTIALREYQDFFSGPIAYIIISVFLTITGWLFFSTFFIYNQAELRAFFQLLPLIFSFLIPAMTMRLFSEEFNIGSYEMLYTTPVTHHDIILGKFTASFLFVTVALLPTLLFAFTTSILGELDWGPVIGGYAGTLLLAAAYISIGLFASSLTKNQIVSFMIAFIITAVLTLMNQFLLFFPPAAANILEFLSSTTHFQNVSRGIIDSRDLIYFLSLIIIFLSLNQLSLKEKQ